MSLLCEKTKEAHLPTRGTEGAAGYDLYLQAPLTLAPGERNLVDLGIKVAIPHGYVGQIKPRSSLVTKQGVTVDAGTIDSDYRGYVKVYLINTSDQERKFNKHDRVAQMLILQCFLGPVEHTTNLERTLRGDGGFGSTGK